MAMADIPLLNNLKRKRTGSPELVVATSQDQTVLKRRKLSTASAQSQGFFMKPPTGTGAQDATQQTSARETTAQPGLRDVHLSSRSSKRASPQLNPSPQLPANMDQPNSSTEEALAVSMDERTAELGQQLEHQLNLEILLKHRELRLIDQELAKCQAALEQLRRCEVIPFPGAQAPSEAVSLGTGPALKPQPGYTQPQAPAPWGVTDGPYTRHYRRWLLNDPTFDSMPVQAAQAPIEYFIGAPEGRSTRNSGATLGARAGKGRASRDSVGNLTNALPNYPSQPRGKGGPLVIKRLADNQYVKLICNNCQRGDFSSVQGFLNHCRIAHKVDYKSHEAAATDCGHRLEEDEQHLIPQGASTTAPVARNPGPKTVAAVAAPVAAPPPQVIVAPVHPLNAPVLPRYTWKVQAEAARERLAVTAAAVAALGDVAKSSRKATKSATEFHSSPLVASSSTPYLSAQFAKHGMGGDLARAITKAREKIDLGPEDTEEDDTSTAATSRKQSISKSNSNATATATSARRFSQSTTNAKAAASTKGARHPTAPRPRPAPLAPAIANARFSVATSHEIPESPLGSHHSPHTADSNPGLVSDHEASDDNASDLDDDDDDDSLEQENAAPPHRRRHHRRQHSAAAPDVDVVSGLPGGGLRGGTCGGEAMDVDIEVEDDGDDHGVLIRPRGLAFQQFEARAGGGSAGARTAGGRFGEGAK